MKKLLVISLVCLLVAGPVGAHVTGASFERSVNGYLIDVGYDPVKFMAGESEVFDFNILKDKNQVDFDQVWVRILKDQKTYLATGIKRSEFGKTSLVYVFPDSGDFQLNVSFRKADDVIAEDTLPITVSAVKSFPTSLITGGTVAAMGLLGGVLLARRK